MTDPSVALAPLQAQIEKLFAEAERDYQSLGIRDYTDHVLQTLKAKLLASLVRREGEKEPLNRTINEGGIHGTDCKSTLTPKRPCDCGAESAVVGASARSAEREKEMSQRKQYAYVVILEADENHQPYTDELWTSIENQPWKHRTVVERIVEIEVPRENKGSAPSDRGLRGTEKLELRRLDTPENRAFWASVDEAVKDWEAVRPEWSRRL